ncbi:substrate-binding periplasmic protein [Ureibacillus composti]
MKNVKYLFFAVAIGLIMLLSACSSSSSDSSSTATSASSGEKEKQVIRVGATTTGVPFTFLNPSSQKIEGIMVDIANKIGEHAGLEVEIVETKFSSLIPSIEANKIDIISAGMLSTPERAEIIDFSTPVYNYGETLIVSKDNESIKSFEDLKGKKVGAQEGTTFYTELSKNSDIETQSYKAMSDMVVEIKNGRIDAFLADYPVMANMINENPDLEVKIIEEYEAQWPGDVSIGLAKGNEELKNKVNDAIAKMKENGEIDEILKKWGL